MDATIVSIGAQGAEQARPALSLLTPEAREDVRSEANRWIKTLRLVRYGDQTMRQRFCYRNDSLWWFTEIYLHKTRDLERAIGTVLALEAAYERDAPHRLTVRSGDATIRAAAAAFGAVRRIPVSVEGPLRHDGRRKQLAGFMVGPAALLSRIRSRRTAPPRHAPHVAAFVHTAFWREASTPDAAGRESYIGPVLDAVAARVAVEDLVFVGVGPRRNFRTRRWWDPWVAPSAGRSVVPIERLAPSRSLAGAIDLWRERELLARQIVEGEDIRAAGIWRGYDLWPVLSAALGHAARVQWPWSARSMDEARSALALLRPEVIVTYAEAGGWGRALMLEARRAAIASVGLQHGFIYRHWLNYQHEADEMTSDGKNLGFPRPDRTLVFDRYASSALTGDGHFPQASVVVTGSPRLDELGEAWATTPGARQSARANLGVAPTDQFVLVAAKFLEIERELPALVAALTGLPDVRVIVKPHPAERPEAYLPYLAGRARFTVAGPDADLGQLLLAADVVATMNSTVAIDGLALGVPALVVGVPNNLSPFVEAGVMVGATGATIRASLESLLYDHVTRRALLERAARFAAEQQIRADGQAASRAADQILTMSHSSRDARQ